MTPLARPSGAVHADDNADDDGDDYDDDHG